MTPGIDSKAVIWDLDGVLADTALFHLRAWQELGRNHGINFTEDAFQQTFGLRNPEIIRKVFGESVSAAKIDELAAEKEECFRQLIEHNVRPLPGAIGLLSLLRDAGFKLGLASSAPLQNILLLTKALGISHAFDCIISGEDVRQGKPNPEIFVMAAEKLEARPWDCLVIEDAVAGIRAAKRAGMRCIAVTNTHPGESLAEADLVVASLEKVGIREIEGLLQSKKGFTEEKTTYKPL